MRDWHSLCKVIGKPKRASKIMMIGVRAYNMNINEIIHSGSKQNEVDEKPSISPEKARVYKTVRETLNNQQEPEIFVKVDVSPIWQDVAGTIDLKNATADEVAVLSSKLFKAGAITFEDHVSLSFAKNPDDRKKINFINQWQDRQEEALRQGASHDDLNDIIRVQSILSFVDSFTE